MVSDFRSSRRRCPGTKDPLLRLTGPEVREVVLSKMVERGVSGEQLENAKAIRWPKTGPLYRHILGTSIKVQKSVKVGWLTAVIYLAPEKESIEYGGINLCPLASKGCPIACLAGNRVVSRLAMSSGRNSKAWKTLLLIYGGGLFEIFLDRALTSHTKTAEKKGLVPAIRLNGSSDWVWESRHQKSSGTTLISRFTITPRFRLVSTASYRQTTILPFPEVKTPRGLTSKAFWVEASTSQSSSQAPALLTVGPSWVKGW